MWQVTHRCKGCVVYSRTEFSDEAAQTQPDLFGKLDLSCARACNGGHDQSAIFVQIGIGVFNASNFFARYGVYRNKTMKFVAQCVESRGHNV